MFKTYLQGLLSTNLASELMSLGLQDLSFPNAKVKCQFKHLPTLLRKALK